MRVIGHRDQVCLEDAPADRCLGACHAPVDVPLVLLVERRQGGSVMIVGNFDEVSNATLRFQEEVKDPKAAILPTYNYVTYATGMVRTHL